MWLCPALNVSECKLAVTTITKGQTDLNMTASLSNVEQLSTLNSTTAYWGRPSVEGTRQPERTWRRSSCNPRQTWPYTELVWIRTTSNGVTDKTSAEEKLTESPVTEGKIVPTLKDKDTRPAEPVGRPQQATSPGTSRQTPSFNPADHQKLIRKIPRTEPSNSPSTLKPQTLTPDPVLSPATSTAAKQLNWDYSCQGTVSPNCLTLW